MERGEGKQYTTGEFAEHFGIKKDTLFYYDKIKLFCPAGVKANGYRYYTSSQIGTFWTLLSLREIGVPVKVLQEYFKEPSPERLNGIAREQIREIEMEIKKLQKIKKLLTNVAAAAAEGMEAVLEQVKIETLPDQRFIYSRENEGKTDTSDQEWESIYDDFVRENKITGTACVGSLISQADLRVGRFGYVSRLFTASAGRSGTVRKGGQYAVCYHKGTYGSIPGTYPDILNGIKRQGFEIAGDAYEEYLIAETAAACEEDYVTKIVIRVSPGSEKDGTAF